MSDLFNEVCPCCAALSQIASQEASQSFVDYRKGMGKRYHLTARAAAMVARSLETIRAQGGDPDEALDIAQERGWMTVKPDWYWKSKRSDGANLKAINGGSDGQPASKSERKIRAWTEGARGSFGTS